MSADAAHPNPDVAARLNRIYTLHRTDIALRLADSPYLALLAKLGNPHEKMPPVIHIAGTNGKGSTLAMLRAMLEADEKRVHIYTSPHLVTFNERIVIGGMQVSDSELIALYDRVEKANDGAPITFFEFTTAMAFVAFAESPADYTLLETGMGGRLDCTNVVDHPAVTAITKISFDHTEFLGTTLEAITAEKAGIMKPDVTCVIGAQMEPDKVLPVFADIAKQVGAKLLTARMPPDYPQPNLVGAHQIENAATALTIAGLLHISEEAKREGLQNAQWPARLQRISMNPDIWFDAAHNDSGAQALAAQLCAWKKESPNQPIHLIVGLAADKDHQAFFRALNGAYDTLTLVDLPNARRPQLAGSLKAKTGLEAETVATAKQAIEKSDRFARHVVAGSLYLYQSLL